MCKACAHLQMVAQQFDSNPADLRAVVRSREECTCSGQGMRHVQSRVSPSARLMWSFRHRPCLLPLTPKICTLQAVAGTQAPTSFDHLSLRLQIQDQLLASLQVARLQLEVLTCLAEAGQHIG